MPAARRFPPPWTLEEKNDACFIVKDATGQALGYFYFEEESGRRSAAKLLSKDVSGLEKAGARRKKQRIGDHCEPGAQHSHTTAVEKERGSLGGRPG